MTKSIPTNIENIKEKVRTLVKEARLAGGGNTYADDSLSLYESDVYQALDELIISGKREVLNDFTKARRKHEQSIGMWGEKGAMLDLKMSAKALTPDEAMERDAMVTERRAMRVLMDIENDVLANLNNRGSDEVDNV